jgi:hypothetical protein
MALEMLRAKNAGTRRWLVVITVYATAYFVSLPMANVAVGQEPTALLEADLIASWTGTVAGISPPQTVTFNITSVTPGSPAGALHFGGRRACALGLEYAGPVGDSYYFTTKRPTGGYCNQLDFGYLDLEFSPPPNDLAFTLSTRDDTVTDKGTAKIQELLERPAADLIGTWSGTVAGISPPQTVTFTITSVTPGSPAGELSFAGRRACKLELEYVAAVGDSYYFTTKRPTGGYCNQLDFGSLDLEFSQSPKESAFTLSKRDDTVTDKGTAKKQVP